MNKASRVLIVTLICLPLLAWDTRTTPRLAWHSPYGSVDDAVLERSPETGQPVRAGAPGSTRNAVPEHTRISDLALRNLGVADLFGQSGEAARSVVDLNASYFRRDLLYGAAEGAGIELTPYGDDSDTLLEERRIAAPANMVGLPDYSYSLLDWLNKTQYCPASSDGTELDRCHEFVGWLGALNSVHFGSQATEMYAHYHTIALSLAARARRLREEMTAAEQALHRDVLLEAELQALTYEAFAQHFLQDRWSMGHMFERWNGGDANQAAYSLASASGQAEQYSALAGNLSVAGMAGAIHGWEGLTRNVAAVHALGSTGDPMSSPFIDGNRLIMPQFRHTSLGNNPNVGDDSPELIDGVGDERFADMLSGGFGAGYGNLTRNIPINVTRQRNGMMSCSMSGWASVIREFGRADTGYGAHGAVLTFPAPDTDPLAQETCWDMWATNKSMWLGFVGQDIRALATLTAISFESSLPNNFTRPALGRSEIASLGWRVWRRQFLAPNGTDLAQGGLGELWGVRDGSAYQLPNFVEPTDLGELPSIDVRGLDRQALFGAFSRSHSDHWCEVRPALLEDVRARISRSAPPSIDQQVCQYVSDMAYQGTHPSQASVLAETLQIESGENARSMCSIHGLAESEAADDPDDPFYLDVGYVAWQSDASTHGQYTSALSPSPAIAEWCARTPIFRLITHEGDTAAHLVGIIRPNNSEIVINGLDLGDQTGRITAHNEETGEAFDVDIAEWSDTSVTLAASGGIVGESDQFYRLDITTHDGRTSVGLFRVYVEEPPALQIVFERALEFTGIQPCHETHRTGDWTACSCTAEATQSGRVIGTYQYEMRSDTCRAALHAGAVGPEGGNVLVRNMANAPFAFLSSAANGVETQSHNGTASTFVFGVIEPPEWARLNIPLCPYMAYGARMPSGQECLCMPALLTDRAVWGTGVYTHDSNLCRAAIHAGAYQGGGLGVIRVLSEPGGRSEYTGSVRNGVESLDWSQHDASIVIYRADSRDPD